MFYITDTFRLGFFRHIPPQLYGVSSKMKKSKPSVTLNKSFGQINTDELLSNIKKFRKLDLRYENDDSILSYLKKIILVKYAVLYTYGAGSQFYRIRKLPDNNQRFLNKKDLLCPPVEVIKDMGRLNNPYESLLYTSPTPLCLINEVKVRNGQEFSLIKYVVKKEQTLDLVSIGLYDSDHGQIINNSLVFDQMRKSFTNKARINFDIIQDFLNTEFTKDVGVGTEFLHRTSTLIAKHFFDSPSVDGFLYPSIASKKGNNVALKPQAVDRAIEIVGLRIFKLVSEHENGSRINSLAGVWSNQIVNDEIIYRPSSKDDLDLYGIGGSEHWYGPLPL